MIKGNEDSTERSMMIGVIGSDDHAGESISAHALEVATAVGRRVAERGAILITGGTGGIMEAASAGARGARGIVVGLLPGVNRADANQHVTIPITTGLGALRSHVTVATSDAIIMIAGSTGTLNEATIAYAQNKPLIVVTGTGGWSDRLGDVLYDGAHFDVRATSAVEFVSTAEDAVERAMKFAETSN